VLNTSIIYKYKHKYFRGDTNLRKKNVINPRRERLIVTREELKMTVQDLAKASGIDRSTLAHIESGRGTSVDIALAIAKNLNRSVEYLFLP
jgi:DNA-binding XRE family transcriptional regulator